MTLDDLECQNRGFYEIFGDLGLRDTFQERIAPNTTDRPRQAAYEIFSIERRFQRFKLRLFRFKENCAWGHQRAVPSKSYYFAVVGKSIVRTVADRHGYAA